MATMYAEGAYQVYNKDYYEHGIETGVSCYQNYRWLPELTISMAMTMIDHLGIKRGESILDFGCAKGFLVKAFRLLGREAVGVDISEYAIANCDPAVKDYCDFAHMRLGKWPNRQHFHYCIAKDVFEHILESELEATLLSIREQSSKLFVVVPLGENGKYTAEPNNYDVTHITCKPLSWWDDKLTEAGWLVEERRYHLAGIKDSYYEVYPEGHGFLVARN